MSGALIDTAAASLRQLVKSISALEEVTNDTWTGKREMPRYFLQTPIRVGECADDGEFKMFEHMSRDVSDTGIGIAETDIPKVLAPFEQVESKHNRTGEGTGLGLPLVKSLVELHGGSITISSRKSRGTVVTVSFPPGRVRFGPGGPQAIGFARQSTQA